MSDPAFKLQEIAAAGTFGTVCIARDLHTGKLVALKVLKGAHLHRPRVVARTRDEALMLTRLDHPNIVHVEGLVYIGDRPVVVMEWVRGVSLEELVRAKPNGLPAGIALRLMLAAVVGLHAAYTSIPMDATRPMEIIHRDVKPSNIILSVRGEVKLVDFGIARGEFEGKESKTLSMVLGARGYLAPERLDGHDDKPSVDLYAIGISLYEMLTGKHIALSVHEAFHAEALEKSLARLTLDEVEPEAVNQMRDLFTRLCAYRESERLSHQETMSQLNYLIENYFQHDSLEEYALEHVLQLFNDRKTTRPVDNPGYSDLAFLDRTGRNCDSPAPPDVNDEIRRALQAPRWLERIGELELLLATNPHWTSEPVLEVLPNVLRPWWQFWQREHVPSPEELVVLLDILGRRPISQDARRRILLLREHPEPTVQEAAADLLDT